MRFLFSALFLFLSLIHAETKPNNTMSYSNSGRYSIEEIINMTLQTHPTIRMNREIIKGSDAQVRGAKWGYYPSPTLSSYQTQNNIFGATLSVDQPLITGGKLDANYNLALAGKKSSEYALEDSAYTLIETLLNEIKTYLQGESTYAALLEGQKQLKILEGMVQRRVAAGVSSKADMELLSARLYQMDTDLNLAKTKRDTALAQIEIMTGRPFDNRLIVDLSAPVVDGSSQSVIDETMNTHPLLKKFDAQIEYARAEIDKSKANIWPNLTLKAQQNFGSSSMTTDIKADNSPFVYLSLQAAPGAGLSARSAIEGSQAKVLQVEQEKLVAKQTILNKIMFAYNDYISATKRVASQSKSVGSSQRVFASYTRLFLAGKRQWLDLVNSSREVTQNEIAFSDVKVTMLISAYQLALYKGDINPLGTSRVIDKAKIANNPDSVLNSPFANSKYVKPVLDHSLVKDVIEKVEEYNEKPKDDASPKAEGYFIELKESEDVALASAIRNSRILAEFKDDKIIVGPYPTPADAFNAIYSVQKEIPQATNNQTKEVNQ